jgi:hypothetical protein
MLAYLDDLDSKVEAMQRLMAEPHANGNWTRISPMFERPIYRRRPDGTAEQAPAAQAAAVAALTTPPNPNSEASTSPKPAKAKSGSFNNPFEQLAELMKE